MSPGECTFLALTFGLLLQGCSESGSQGTNQTPLVGSGSGKAKAQIARSGPFGLAIGMPMNELVGTETASSPGWLRLSKVPRPHTLIEYVGVQGYPETGVCFIKGIGFAKADDPLGTAAKTEYQRLVSELKTKYGEPTKTIDMCLSDHCFPQYWAMELHRGEREFATVWVSAPARPLPEDIEQLAVGLVANGHDSTNVAVEYYGTNTKQCEEVEKKAQAGAH